ncbi:hypothetical protein GWK47_009260 [Chionoecetes opilio]|uniref:Uncharacterized protein n=1 Tax=Chionoecetes opilio TaxID=41210 RepID=A0A8J4Y5G8_CHIOP|nr:hypothetical protein GWK47_009260 [Chionoecetes opilio]
MGEGMLEKLMMAMIQLSLEFLLLLKFFRLSGQTALSSLGSQGLLDQVFLRCPHGVNVVLLAWSWNGSMYAMRPSEVDKEVDNHGGQTATNGPCPPCRARAPGNQISRPQSRISVARAREARPTTPQAPREPREGAWCVSFTGLTPPTREPGRSITPRIPSVTHRSLFQEDSEELNQYVERLDNIHSVLGLTHKKQ